MSLSADLISQFVKMTNDKQNNKVESTVYGTTVEQNGTLYVRFDGSELLTPVSTTADMNPKGGERVVVMIKNHTAIVTGNISSPSARNEVVIALDGEVKEISGKVANFEVVIADKVSTEQLYAEVAKIEDLQAENVVITGNLNAAVADISTLKADNVTIDGKLTANDASIKNLQAQDVTITGRLDANDASIKTLQAQDVTITGKLTANEANISKLSTDKLDATAADIKYAKITDLNASNAKIGTLEADVADIDTLIFGSASGTTIQSSFANAVVAQLGNAQIKSAMIDSVSAEKIAAGDIVTNNVRVVSSDGKLLISDETIQISDDTRVRVQIGKDAADDYSINIWDDDGNLMFSKGGITDSAIKEAIIRNDMVKDDANISASKLDIDSLFTEINGSTKTIKSSKVYLDEKNQSLDVAFTAMSSDVNGLRDDVDTQGTAISVMQGQISSKIWQQDIDTAIDGVEVGGRNLLLGTKFDDISSLLMWSNLGTLVKTDNGLKFTATTSSLNGVKFPLAFDDCLENDTEYTLSFSYRTSSAKLGAIYVLQRSGANVVVKTSLDITPSETDWQKFSTSFSSSNINPGTGWALLIPYITNSWIEFKAGSLKLEKGNKATDWTPAPEDVEGAVTTLDTKYSELKQSTDGVAITVGQHTTELTNKAGRDEVTAVSDRVTSVETDLSGFKTTVSSTYAPKHIPDTRNDNQTPEWYFTNYPKQVVTEFKLCRVVGLSGENYCTLTTTTPRTESSGGYPKQVARVNQKEYWRVGISLTEWGAWSDPLGVASDAQTRVATAETKIDQNAEAITLRATKTELSSAIDGVEIGGRNLLKDSRRIRLVTNNNTLYPIANTTMTENGRTFYRVTRTNTTSYPTKMSMYNSISTTLTTEKLTGKEVTFSFLCRSSHNIQCTMMLGLVGGSISYWPTIDNVINVSTSWTRIYRTVTITQDYEISSANVFRFSPYDVTIPDGEIDNFYLDICEFKIELGNKATDWTPAPEDSYTKTETDALIKVESDKIASVVSSVNTLGSRTSTLEQRADGLSLTLNETAGKIDNLSIGGRNLLLGTDFKDVSIFKRYFEHSADFGSFSSLEKTDGGLKFTSNGSIDDGVKFPLVFDNCLENNTDYTLSFSYRTNSTRLGILYVLQRTSPNVYIRDGLTLVPSETEWQKFSATFKSSDINPRTSYALLLPYLANAWVEFKDCSLKLEKGNKATDWTPAPEDVDSNITNASKTATDYLSYDATNGLQVGNKSSGSWSGTRAQILPDSFNILDADGTTVASYGKDLIELGKGSSEATIEMCGGTGKLAHVNDGVIEYMQLSGEGIPVRIYSEYGAHIYSYSYSGVNTSYKSSVDVRANNVFISSLKSTDIDSTGTGTFLGSKIDMNNEDILIMADSLLLHGQYGSRYSTFNGDITIEPVGNVLLEPSGYLRSSNKFFISADEKTGFNDGIAGWYFGTDGTAHVTRATGGSGIYFHYKGSTATTSSIVESASGTISINGMTFGTNKVLWSGGAYMDGTQTATLSEAVSAQAHGIVLIFSAYLNGASKDFHWTTHFVPKYLVTKDGGGGTNFLMSGAGDFADYAAKYLYINDTVIAGHANNKGAGTGACGITYNNTAYVLRYVIGV